MHSVAMGDACMECFSLWQEHAKHLSWETFGDRMLDTEDSLKSNLKEASRLKLHPEEKKWKAQHVSGGHTCMLEMNKSFKALTLSDLRKLLGATKISKEIQEKAPQVVLRNEHGEQETFYLFKNEEDPHRTLNVKMQQNVTWTVDHLASEKQSWTQQAGDVFQWTSSTSWDDAGVKSLLMKLAVPTMEEFKVKAASSLAKDDDGSGNELGDESEEEGQLSGPAVGFVQLQTPVGAKKKQKISHTAMESSKLSRASSGLQASDGHDGECKDDDDDDDDDDDNEGDDIIPASLCGTALSQFGGTSSVDGRGYGAPNNCSSKKLPVHDALHGDDKGKFDQRPVDAFKRHIDQLELKPGRSAEVGLLRNYHKVLEHAIYLRKNPFTCSLEEVHEKIQKVIDEKCTLSEFVMSKLAEKHVQVHLEKKEYEDMVKVLMPFAADEGMKWSVQCPCVSAMDSDVASKCCSYETILKRSVLKPMLAIGEPGAEAIGRVAGIVVQQMQACSPLSMENVEAKTRASSILLFQCLQALLCDSIDITKQVMNKHSLPTFGEDYSWPCMHVSWCMCCPYKIKPKLQLFQEAQFIATVLLCTPHVICSQVSLIYDHKTNTHTHTHLVQNVVGDFPQNGQTQPFKVADCVGRRVATLQCSCLQEAVQKVHAQAGKTVKTLLAEAHVEITDVELYAGRLSAYVRDLPGHIECHQELEIAFACLEELDALDEQAMQSIVGVLRKFPKCKELLRKCSVESTEALLGSKLKMLSDQMMNDPSKAHLVEKLGELLGEAVIALPMSKQVGELKESLGQHLANKAKIEAASTLTQVLEEVVKLEEIGKFWDLAEQFVGGTTAACTLSSGSVEPVALNVLKLMDKLFTAKPDPTHKPTLLLTWFENLSGVLAEGPFKQVMSALAICVKHALDIDSLARPSESSGQLPLDSLQLLSTSELKLEKGTAELESALKADGKTSLEEWLGPFKSERNVGKKRLQSDLEWHENAQKKNVDEALKVYQGFVVKPKKWLDSCKSIKNLKDAETLAKETVCAVQPSTYDPIVKQVVEVLKT
eukprot:1622490-Amphidinium_carterae.3